MLHDYRYWIGQALLLVVLRLVCDNVSAGSGVLGSGSGAQEDW